MREEKRVLSSIRQIIRASRCSPTSSGVPERVGVSESGKPRSRRKIFDIDNGLAVPFNVHNSPRGSHDSRSLAHIFARGGLGTQFPVWIFAW